MGNHYSANGVGEIREQFSVEGDSLARHGHREPDLTHPPEEFEEAVRDGRIALRGSSQSGLADIDPTGASEWGDPLRYSRSNGRAVNEWIRQEASGQLGGALLPRTLE